MTSPRAPPGKYTIYNKGPPGIHRGPFPYPPVSCQRGASRQGRTGTTPGRSGGTGYVSPGGPVCLPRGSSPTPSSGSSGTPSPGSRIPPGVPGPPPGFHRGVQGCSPGPQVRPRSAPGCSPGVQGPPPAPPRDAPRGFPGGPGSVHRPPGEKGGPGGGTRVSFPARGTTTPGFRGEAGGRPGGQIRGPPGGCKGKIEPIVNFYFPNGVFERKSPILPPVFHGFDLPRLLILFFRAISPHNPPRFPTVPPGGKGGCTYGQYPTASPGGPLRERHSIASGFRGVPRGFPVQPVPVPRGSLWFPLFLPTGSRRFSPDSPYWFPGFTLLVPRGSPAVPRWFPIGSRRFPNGSTWFSYRFPYRFPGCSPDAP